MAYPLLLPDFRKFGADSSGKQQLRRLWQKTKISSMNTILTGTSLISRNLLFMI
jgi:hypothetical protein